MGRSRRLFSRMLTRNFNINLGRAYGKRTSGFGTRTDFGNWSSVLSAYSTAHSCVPIDAIDAIATSTSTGGNSPQTQAQAPLSHSLSNENKITDYSVFDMSLNNEEPRKRSRIDFKSQGATNFPAKLHFVLESLEKDGQSDIMSWQPHGRAFMIRDKARLVAEVLPSWFRQTNFPSFQRQLNLYNFTRVYKGPDHGAYYHPSFLRDQPVLAHSMVRVPVKGKRSNPDEEERSVSNFYQDHDLNQAAREPAAMAQPLSSLPPVVQAPLGSTLLASLQANAMSRMATYPHATELTAFNTLANRYPYQAGIPWPARPEQPPNLLSLYNPTITLAELQQTPIEAYLRELMLLSSIRQDLSRR